MRTVAALAAAAVVDVAVVLRAQRREWQRLLKPLLLPVGVVVVREQRLAQTLLFGSSVPTDTWELTGTQPMDPSHPVAETSTDPSTAFKK